jgi:hypothetical protein
VADGSNIGFAFKEYPGIYSDCFDINKERQKLRYSAIFNNHVAPSNFLL